MDRLIYTALSGLRANLDQQSVTAHNIANVSTPGFRRDISARDARNVSGESFASRIQSAAQTYGIDGAPGQNMPTGRALDISLAQNNYLAVQDRTGAEAYTKRGDLRAGVTGLLETGDGHPVLGINGPITVPSGDSLEIGTDGTISLQPKGAARTERINIGQLKLVTAFPEELKKTADNLLHPVEGETLPTDGNARLVSGMLEGSNVNMAGEMINLIEEARRYEIQVRLVTTARDLDQSSTALLQLQA
jgi:flagellar basal-body rod protein FlgF